MNDISSRRKKRSKGAVLVENAFVLLSLILMITFIMDMGQLLMFLQQFTYRVRAGARYAATNIYDVDRIRNFIVYNNPDGPANPDRTTGDFGLTPSMVSVARYDAGTNLDRIEVSINNYPVFSYTPLIARRYTWRAFRTVVPVESLGATN